jgi:excisionase family DNA binding protein
MLDGRMTSNIDTPVGTARNTEQNSPRDYENKRQLAARLGISERTICNLMCRGLPHIKLTRKLIRFPRAAVDEWLAERQVRRA